MKPQERLKPFKRVVEKEFKPSRREIVIGDNNMRKLPKSMITDGQKQLILLEPLLLST